MGFADELLAAAREQSLEDHPFIRGLARGAYSRESLEAYLLGLYPMVYRFPMTLARVYANCDDPEIRCHLLSNIMEEEGITVESDGSFVRHGARSHVALFRRAMDALGITPPEVEEPPSAWFDQELARGAWIGPAAFLMVGSEGNVPRTYARFLPYLIEHCGLTEEETVFFSEHIEADQDHAARGAALIEMAVSTPAEREEALRGARMGARAWWAVHHRWAKWMKRADASSSAA